MTNKYFNFEAGMVERALIAYDAFTTGQDKREKLSKLLDNLYAISRGYRDESRGTCFNIADIYCYMIFTSFVKLAYSSKYPVERMVYSEKSEEDCIHIHKSTKNKWDESTEHGGARKEFLAVMIQVVEGVINLESKK